MFVLLPFNKTELLSSHILPSKFTSTSSARCKKYNYLGSYGVIDKKKRYTKEVGIGVTLIVTTIM